MIIHGNCLEEMRKMEDNSISAIVTDPPYGLKFMGKDWDHGVPGVEFWKEALRISKPGTWMLAFGGSRTYHRLTCSIEDAGWEIRDCIMWMYGSGFPKSKGCLKPAYEPIIMARKPGCKVRDKFLNIDDCRIPTDEKWKQKCHDIRNNGLLSKKGRLDRISCSHDNGRWPPNVILDEESSELMGKPSRFFYCPKASSNERNEGLDGMEVKEKPLMREFNNNPGRETPKSSPTPRANFHPCVKPLKLMEYLIKLVMPKEGILLDPFVGSGTTVLAAKQLGFEALGIEMNKEYCEIAEARIKLMSTKELD